MEILKAVVLLTILSLLANPVYAQGAAVLAPSATLDSDTCFDCHVKDSDAKLSDPAKDWEDSVHAETDVTCERCHSASVPVGRLAKFGEYGGSYRDDHVDVKFEDYTMEQGPISKEKEALDYKAPSAYEVPDSAGEYTLVVRKGLSKAQIISMCARCHGSTPLDAENPKDVYADFRDDIHGASIMLSQGDPGRMDALGLEASTGEDAPGCTDCHDAHNTVALKDQGLQESINTCAGPVIGEGCHSSDAVAEKYELSNSYETYQNTHHGKALSFGVETVPGCSDCHKSHGIVSADDSASPMSIENRADTCGQEDCHNAQLNVALGSMHFNDPISIAGVSASSLIDLFYSIVIPVVVGFFGLFVVTDFVSSITGRGGK